MKREDEIRQYCIEQGFPQGACSSILEVKAIVATEAIKWADKTMIEKACEWIESYLFDIGFPDDWCRDSPTMKSGKQRFLEAMEE